MCPDLEDSLNDHVHISLCAWFVYIFCYVFTDMMEIIKLLDFLKTNSSFFGRFLKNARSIDL